MLKKIIKLAMATPTSELIEQLKNSINELESSNNPELSEQDSINLINKVIINCMLLEHNLSCKGKNVQEVMDEVDLIVTGVNLFNPSIN